MAFYVEAAGTNLIANPSAEVNVAELITARLSVDTYEYVNDAPLFGSTELHVVASTAGAGPRWITNDNLNLTGETRIYTGSIHIRGTGNVSVSTHIEYGDGTFTTGIEIPVTIHPTEYRRFFAGTVASDPAKTIRRMFVDVRQVGSGETETYTDGAQIEEGTLMTSYIDGSQGDGFAWTGDPDKSASTRSASRLSLPIGILPHNAGAIAVRAKPQLRPNTQAVVVDAGQTASGEDLFQLRYEANGSVTFEWYSDSSEIGQIATSAVPPTYERALYYMAWDGTAIELRMNDLPKLTSTRGDGGIGFNPMRLIHLGTDRNGDRSINGTIEDVVVFHRPLTDAEYDRLFAAESWTWSTIRE